MLIFLACSVANVTCFIVLFIKTEEDLSKHEHIVEIPTMVASGLITGILFWYTYQMKIVLLKI